MIEELIEEAGLKPYGSSAEKLINLFSSFDDVNFMYLLHTQESGFVKIKRSKKKTQNETAMDSSVGVSHQAMQDWRKELGVSESEKISKL